MAVIHLCFDTYERTSEAFAMMASSKSVERAFHGHGAERIDLFDGTTIRFHTLTKIHPPRGINCGCVRRG